MTRKFVKLCNIPSIDFNNQDITLVCIMVLTLNIDKRNSYKITYDDVEK